MFEPWFHDMSTIDGRLTLALALDDEYDLRTGKGVSRAAPFTHSKCTEDIRDLQEGSPPEA